MMVRPSGRSDHWCSAKVRTEMSDWPSQTGTRVGAPERNAEAELHDRQPRSARPAACSSQASRTARVARGDQLACRWQGSRRSPSGGLMQQAADHCVVERQRSLSSVRATSRGARARGSSFPGSSNGSVRRLVGVVAQMQRLETAERIDEADRQADQQLVHPALCGSDGRARGLVHQRRLHAPARRPARSTRLPDRTARERPPSSAQAAVTSYDEKRPSAIRWPGFFLRCAQFFLACSRPLPPVAGTQIDL